MPYKDIAKDREWHRARAARIRAEFFTGKICEWCGSGEELELHHMEPENKTSHHIWTWSKARREAEIAKCMILCETCHDAIHRAFTEDVSRNLNVSTNMVASEV